MTKTIKTWNPTENVTDLLPDDVFGICMKLSGGADSSVLYYRLCKELSDQGRDIPIYVATLDCETKPWYSHYAKKVIEFTAQHTGIRPVEHNIVYLPLPWDAEVKYVQVQDECAYKSFRDGNTNVWFGGLTQNPDPEAQAAGALGVEGIKWRTLEEILPECDRGDPDRNNNTRRLIRTFHYIEDKYPLYAIHPFVHRDKKASTAQMYIDNDLLDTLLPLTYSCEAAYGKTQFVDKVQLDTLISPGIHEEEHCGRCWFCLERAYAFGRLV